MEFLKSVFGKTYSIFEMVVFILLLNGNFWVFLLGGVVVARVLNFYIFRYLEDKTSVKENTIEKLSNSDPE